MHEHQTTLNGGFTPEGNYLWGAALTLAWKQFQQRIIKQNVRIDTNDTEAIKAIHNFNHSLLSKESLSQESYLAKAGFGNQTVNEINNQMKKKFPKKTAKELPPLASENQFVAYAYLFKNLQFNHAFNKTSLLFKEKTVEGFTALTPSQKQQVHIHSYQNPENFIISLSTKCQKDQIYLIKTQQQLTPETAMEKIEKVGKGTRMSENDEFMMPNVNISVNRSIDSLHNAHILNEGFENRHISSVYEIIKFQINEKGIVLENEGYIEEENWLQGEQSKILHLNKPFWLLMREQNQHPYLVMFVNKPIGVKTLISLQPLKKSKSSCCHPM